MPLHELMNPREAEKPIRPDMPTEEEAEEYERMLAAWKAKYEPRDVADCSKYSKG